MHKEGLEFTRVFAPGGSLKPRVPPKPHNEGFSDLFEEDGGIGGENSASRPVLIRMRLRAAEAK